jgi:hypothetical protein
MDMVEGLGHTVERGYKLGAGMVFLGFDQGGTSSFGRCCWLFVAGKLKKRLIFVSVFVKKISSEDSELIRRHPNGKGM